MITFLVKKDHFYTLDALGADFGAPLPPHSILAYEDMFRAVTIPASTYLFCDIERLSDHELLAAAEAAATIRRDGFRVLNDPARVRTRYGLLRALSEAGINQFDAYRADGFPRPMRFPVFVRAEAFHDKPVTDLLPDQEALNRALETLPLGGIPLRGLIVIEFCAEAYRQGVWRTYGAFRIGDEIQLAHVVSQSTWNVKYGEMGLVDEATYADDHAKFVANTWQEEVRAAFDIACIQYGRADFGIVDGRPQIYEINTNPGLPTPDIHPSPIRTQSIRFEQERVAAMLVALDEEHHEASICLDGPLCTAMQPPAPTVQPPVPPAPTRTWWKPFRSKPPRQ